MKITIFVAALTAIILGQAGVSAAESTPAILKSIKAKQTLNKGQMKKVKGEWYSPYLYNTGFYNRGYYPYNTGFAYDSRYLNNTTCQYNTAYLYIGPFGWYFH